MSSRQTQHRVSGEFRSSHYVWAPLMESLLLQMTTPPQSSRLTNPTTLLIMNCKDVGNRESPDTLSPRNKQLFVFLQQLID